MTVPLSEPWPRLDYKAWKDTGRALHLWCQIVGKVRLAQTPWLNHSWHAPLYLSPRGLTTGIVPHGDRALDLEFDFLDQVLRLRTDGPQTEVALRPMSVADFHGQVMEALALLGTPVSIHGAPNELPEAVPFAEDRVPRPYQPEQAYRFWRALLKADAVLKRFRTGFVGKASPSHFFWGSFDLAATRFSGRRAPPHPGGVANLPDAVAREAYSHEVSSAGFWPGGEGAEEAVFYCYAYPEPKGFREVAVEPQQARFDERLGEFILPYEAVRASPDPETTLMRFLKSAYAAAADLGGWPRETLECDLGVPRRPRPA